jgi:hypothetical protein
VTLYCDMDGVVADFERGYEIMFGEKAPARTAPKPERDRMWKNVRSVGNFFLSLPLIPDAQVLWEYIKNYNPTFLTGIDASVDPCENDKRSWIINHFGSHVPVICCEASEKARWCNPGDTIIDDLAKHRQKWLDKGGRWVLHTSATDSILQLKALGI